MKPSPKKKPTAETVLKEMNEKYCVVKDGSNAKVSVLSFERYVRKIGQMEYVRLIPTFMSFGGFTSYYCNRTVKDKNKNIGIGGFWLNHPERRTYEGITFKPDGEAVIDDRLNLWRGWGVESKQGDWSLMQAHIKVVMASDNQEHYDYIMSWLAWAVQHPDQQAEVALIFRGKRGTGKGTLGNAMCRIFGQHGVHVSSAEHLTGRFNAHMRDACFLFADEAYFPGQREAEGNLKRLITEPTIRVEGKGRDSIEVPNMLHPLVASNEDWIIPAGEFERRYVMMEVSSNYIQNEAWFEPLYQQMENGGYSAMLFDLLNFDLGNWHPRKLPKNTGLSDQQKRSLSPLDSWFVELLESGTLAGSDPDEPHCARSGKWQKLIDDDLEHPRYVTMNGLLDAARTIEPRLRHHTSDNTIGDYLKKQGCDNEHRVLRARGWSFPPLANLRDNWEKRFPGWKWRNPKVIDWQPEENEFDQPKSFDDLKMEARHAVTEYKRAKAERKAKADAAAQKAGHKTKADTKADTRKKARF